MPDPSNSDRSDLLSPLTAVPPACVSTRPTSGNPAQGANGRTPRFCCQAPTAAQLFDTPASPNGRSPRTRPTGHKSSSLSGAA
eukprot:9525026-Lingulodinium_polyedra.AAC.1